MARASESLPATLMLPLTSIRNATLMGARSSASNVTIRCGTPPSKTSKSVCWRPRSGRPRPSRTDAWIGTSSTLALKVNGSCALGSVEWAAVGRGAEGSKQDHPGEERSRSTTNQDQVHSSDGGDQHRGPPPSNRIAGRSRTYCGGAVTPSAHAGPPTKDRRTTGFRPLRVKAYGVPRGTTLSQPGVIACAL